MIYRYFVYIEFLGIKSVLESNKLLLILKYDLQEIDVFIKRRVSVSFRYARI